MHGVVLVPNNRRDILWLNSIYEMNYTNWNDVVDHWANPPINSSSDAPAAGAYVNLGGIFASPPVAVALSESRLDVFGLGTDYAVYHKTFDASIANPASQWTPDWERLGGNFMSTPVVVSTGAQQIDLFGLGIDQGMVHISWNGTVWSDWDELGGCFSSPPVVLPTATGTFDIFARAIDYKLYHLAYDPTTQTDWKILGGGLLGEPFAASAPSALRIQSLIFLFVVGDDGAMWSIVFDGKLWKPWSSLGAAQVAAAGSNVPNTSFFSEPVALWTPASKLITPIPVINPNPVSQQSMLTAPLPNAANATSSGGAAVAGLATGATSSKPAATATSPFSGRIDVFATGSDGALWQMWMDNTGWQESWLSLGGVLACAPSVIRPEISVIQSLTDPLQFNVLEPGDNSVVRLRIFDGKTWTYAWPVGPIFSQPNAFSIGVSEVDIASLRSNGKLGETDTDNGTATLSVGRWPTLTAYLDMGNVGTGSHPVDLGMSLNRVPIELCEPFIYFYVILNQGNTNSTTTDAVAQIIAKGAEDYLNDQFKNLLNPASNYSFLGLIETGALADAGGGPFLIASLIGAAVAVGLDAALSALLANCDGLVASGTVSYLNGRTLQQQLRSVSPGQITGKIHSPGTDSQSGCGGNSDYTVTYYVQRG